VKPGDQGTTFGGGPVACAALAATLEVIEEEELVENAARMGEILASEVSAIPGVKEVRGRGLLRGIALDRPAKPVRNALIEKRILTGTAPGDPDVLRLMPPLTLAPDEAEPFYGALREALS
jgi:acetylornithine/succinyldiaminopimelate/putrescine aminotransferase